MLDFYLASTSSSTASLSAGLLFSVDMVVDGQPLYWAFIMICVGIVVDGQPSCWTFMMICIDIVVVDGQPS